MNELQNTTVNAPATFSFKSAKLNAYSKQIANIGAKMATQNVELAKILGKVATEECYKEDGFKSVSDYAEQTFGIARTQAYKLAQVGQRFYNNPSETAQKVVATLTPSNMAEIAKLTDTQIADCMKEGTISENSKQAELRAVASRIKGARKNGGLEAIAEPALTITATVCTASGVHEYHEDKLSYSLFKEKHFDEIDTEKKVNDTVRLILFKNGDFARVIMHKPVKVKEEPKKAKFTVEELMAMLEAAQKEQAGE